MKRAIAALAALVAIAITAIAWLNLRGDWHENRADDHVATPASIEAGRYLARVGNCAGCHTRRGGEPYAGGRGIPTPFGTVFASNLTPDVEHGIGRWTRADFWRAMHNGRSRSGRLLYPAFPYPHYTAVRREDADAIFDYLQSLAPAAEPNRAHGLRFPYDSQAALAIWRALYFRPGEFVPDASHPPQWNRGAYLVRGLGHCGACHASRNPFGAPSDSDALGGGLIPMQGWYAPSLAARSEAGVQHWKAADIVALLTTGLSPQASVLGPMAEVVYRSTQYLSSDDAHAIAAFLQSLPEIAVPPIAADLKLDARRMEQGRALYDKHCADCHRDDGKGWSGVYPALAGNRAVLLDNPANTIRAVLSGGFPPGTTGNPRPYGMPPFAPFLDDADVAAVVTYIRNAWGNRATPVADWQVGRLGRGAERE